MPTPRSQQKYGGWTWTLMMFSMNTCISMFFLGSIGQGLGLNYPGQLRPAFGFRGTHIPVIMKGISGLVWFGVEAWAGSLAITMIVVSLAGVSKDMVTTMAIKYLVIALVVYLGSFILVMLFGLQGIGQMANWAGRSCWCTSCGW